MDHTRRRYLAGLAGAGGLAVGGCLGDGGRDAIDGGEGSADGGDPETASDDGTDAEGASPPPFGEVDLHVGHDLATIDDAIRSGGVSKDGIPSIDDPEFGPPEAAPLDPADPVFGLVRNGVARAYPQHVLVHHEIVNDVVGGEPVAVTYCPLTGTVQGFERGETEFGVSGRLSNSNLVMYDRATDTWWPQVLATGVRGPHAGETLREFRVVWTTWERWRSVHPETDVLTRDTGYTRRYDDDPYGGYNPKGGYYVTDGTMFDTLARDDEIHDKRVAIGARTAEGAIVFDKESLLSERVLAGDLTGTVHVAVADPELATGYVYANPDGSEVTPDGDGYRLDGERYAAADLPLERVLAFDGMYFVWYAFYPDLIYVR